MIYKTTVYNSKTNHHYANNPKNIWRKGDTHTHTHTNTNKELAPKNYAMTFNTTSITVLVSVQNV